MKKLIGAFLAALLLAALPGSNAAWAQAACSIAAGTIQVKTGNYTLAATDICSFLNFTSGATLTLPPATSFPAGFNVWVKGNGATVTVSPGTSGVSVLLDGAATTASVTTGTGIGLRTNGVTWYSTGLGISH